MHLCRQRSRYDIEAAGQDDLTQPLLTRAETDPQALEASPSFARDSYGPRSKAQAIGRGPSHHHVSMARSVRLGFNALSPHDMGEMGDERESGVQGESADVVDPMVRRSTAWSAGM